VAHWLGASALGGMLWAALGLAARDSPKVTHGLRQRCHPDLILAATRIDSYAPEPPEQGPITLRHKPRNRRHTRVRGCDRV